MATLSAVGSAATAARNSQVLSAALTKVRAAVAKATRYPMPGCADRKGYWEVPLTALKRTGGDISRIW